MKGHLNKIRPCKSWRSKELHKLFNRLTSNFPLISKMIQLQVPIRTLYRIFPTMADVLLKWPEIQNWVLVLSMMLWLPQWTNLLKRWTMPKILKQHHFRINLQVQGDLVKRYLNILWRKKWMRAWWHSLSPCSKKRYQLIAFHETRQLIICQSQNWILSLNFPVTLNLRFQEGERQTEEIREVGLSCFNVVNIKMLTSLLPLLWWLNRRTKLKV